MLPRCAQSLIRLVGRVAPPRSITRSSLSQKFSSTIAWEGLPGVPILPCKTSSHGSVTIDVRDMEEGHDTSDFGIMLISSLAAFRNAKRSACWINVPIDLAHLIPIASAHGFRFHHAEGDMATLSIWLVPGVESKIPSFATHQVGVGGLVLRGGEDGRPVEALVVREARENYGVKYKLPGGLVNLGEDFGDAAAREVQEETGVQSRFEKVLTLRHQHAVQFARSDIYVIVQLRAVTEEIVLDDYELEFARWMDLGELREVSDHAMLVRAIDVATGAGGVPLEEAELESVVPGRIPYKLYHAPAPKSAK